MLRRSRSTRSESQDDVDYGAYTRLQATEKPAASTTVDALKDKARQLADSLWHTAQRVSRWTSVDQPHFVVSGRSRDPSPRPYPERR